MYGVLLEQGDDGGAAELEASLLCPTLDGACTVEVADASHHEGAHLHLHHRAEVVGVQDGVLPAVLAEHGTVQEGDGADGVELAGEVDVLPFGTAVQVVVAVVVVHGEAEDEAVAALKLCC